MAASSTEQLAVEINKAVTAAEAVAKGESQALEGALQSLELLKNLQVSTQLLVETQGGKTIRKLTKHQNEAIKAAASDVVLAWKSVVAAEASASAANTTGGSGASEAGTSGRSQANGQDDGQPAAKKQKTDPDNAPAKKIKTEQEAAAPVKSEKPGIKRPPKPLVIPKTGDDARDKIRTQLADALNLAADIVPEGDPGQKAAEIEEAVLKQNGTVNPKYKARIRSIWVNLKDLKNPDFRASILLGEITGEEAVNLKAEEMASKARQEENARIREAAMFEAERGKRRMATTDQFQCGRCKNRQTSYYQMQTRSADEPMTTFVICQVCDNRWKFC